MTIYCCKDLEDSIDKGIDENVYTTDNDDYYLTFDVYLRGCGYDKTIYKKILYCPFCGVKL